jgi:hypothetical protein
MPLPVIQSNFRAFRSERLPHEAYARQDAFHADSYIIVYAAEDSLVVNTLRKRVSGRSRPRRTVAHQVVSSAEYAERSWERVRRGVPGGASPLGCFPPAMSAARRERIKER